MGCIVVGYAHAQEGRVCVDWCIGFWALGTSYNRPFVSFRYLSASNKLVVFIGFRGAKHTCMHVFYVHVYM